MATISQKLMPKVLPKLLSDANAEKSGRVMKAMLQMHKLDIAALEKAAA